MRQSWTVFLNDPESAGHAVEVYSELAELGASVATHLATGFAAGGAGVLVARPAHVQSFRERLDAAGWDCEALELDGRLVVADAVATLDAFMDGDLPSADRFEDVVGALLDRAGAAGGGTVRVFGEMVDVLNERGLPGAALALEGLWNAAAESRRFSLLCGYRLDLFDAATQAVLLPHICAAHSHVLPAHDSDRLADAVDRALVEVLGEDEAANVQLMVGTQIHEDRMPTAQLVLMWVSETMPLLAERVLASARSHYAAPAAA